MMTDFRAIALATERGPVYRKHPPLVDTFDGKHDGTNMWVLQLCLHRTSIYENITGEWSAIYTGPFTKGDLFENLCHYPNWLGLVFYAGGRKHLHLDRVEKPSKRCPPPCHIIAVLKASKTVSGNSCFDA